MHVRIKCVNYQVNVVSIKISDALEIWRRCRSLLIAVSFMIHFNLFMTFIDWSVFNIFRVCFSSKKIETQSIRTTMTCSIMMSDLRDLKIFCFSNTYSCSWLRQTLMPVTFMKTARVEWEASFALSAKFFMRLDTWHVATISSTIEVATDREFISYKINNVESRDVRLWMLNSLQHYNISWIYVNCRELTQLSWLRNLTRL